MKLGAIGTEQPHVSVRVSYNASVSQEHYMYRVGNRSYRPEAVELTEDEGVATDSFERTLKVHWCSAIGFPSGKMGSRMRVGCDGMKYR